MKEIQGSTLGNNSAESKTHCRQVMSKGERRPRRWLRKKSHLTSSFAFCLAGNNTDRCFICLWLGEGFRFWLYGCWLETDKKFRFCLFSWKAWRYHLENPMPFSIFLTNLWYLLTVMPVKSWLCSRKSWWKLNTPLPAGQCFPGRRPCFVAGQQWEEEKEVSFPKQGVCPHQCHCFYYLPLSSFSLKQRKSQHQRARC